MAAATFYPACAPTGALDPKPMRVGPWKAKVPVLVLLGALDDITPPETCQEVSKRGSPK